MKPHTTSIVKTQHTPGPWKTTWQQRGNIESDFSKLPKLPLVTTDFHESGKITNGPEADICQFADTPQRASDCGAGFSHTISMDEAFANARLIAAAPDLLKACLRMIELDDDSVSGIGLDIADRRLLLSAIKDATQP